MTKAFKQGFMDMMRKIASCRTRKMQKRAWADADDFQDALAQQWATRNTPMNADSLSAAVRAMMDDDEYNKGVERANEYVRDNDPDATGIPFTLQAGIDSLPDPGPGVRMPTPYELYQLANEYEKNYEGTTGEDALRDAFEDNHDAARGLETLGVLPFFDRGSDLGATIAPLSEEFARRAWNTATSAVPISATSDGPVPGYKKPEFTPSNSDDKPNPAEPPAGIGRYDHFIGVDEGKAYSNSPNTYLARLLDNLSLDGPHRGAAGFNLKWHYPTGGEYNTDIPQRDVDYARARQAEGNVNALGFTGAPGDKLQQNLINAGKQNQQNFIDTGTVPKRETLDRTGIEDLKLTPEEESSLLDMQNTMVKNRGKPRAGVVA